MRLFIAIRPDDGILQALVEAQEALSLRGIHGSPVPPGNLHLTLAFIGEYPDPDPVLSAMEKVHFSPFPMALGSVGSFGSKIVWAGVRESQPLRQLSERLRQELAGADIPFDRKPFLPHITLFRGADPGVTVPEIFVPEDSMAVDNISLFRSDRGQSGMIYTETGSVRASQ